MNVKRVNFRKEVEPETMQTWLKAFADMVVSKTQSQIKYEDEQAVIQFGARLSDEVYEITVPYSKMYSRVAKEIMKHDFSNRKCFVHYTKATTSRALASRFILREYDKEDISSSHIQIEKWKFPKTALTPLADMDFHQTVRFVKLYMMEYIVTKGGGKLNPDFIEEIGIGQDGLPTYMVKKRKHSGVKVMDLDDVEAEQVKKTKKQKTEGKEKMGGTIMTAAEKAEAVAKQAFEINKEAVMLAAKLEVGNVAVQQIKDKITFGWFADKKIKKHPFFDIALANVVGVALREFAGGNEKAELLSEAMIQSAAVNMAQSFNVNEMVNDLLKNVDLSKLKPGKE